MKKTQFSEEQIIQVLKLAEADQKVADICRAHGISEGTFYRWKARYGGMDVNQLRRLQQLEDENRTERTVRSANAHLQPLPSSAPERVFLFGYSSRPLIVIIIRDNAARRTTLPTERGDS